MKTNRILGIGAILGTALLATDAFAYTCVEPGPAGACDNSTGGSNTTIGGGYGNTAGQPFDTVGGGNYNQVNAGYSVVCGGAFNFVTGQYAGSYSGYGNDVTGRYSSASGLYNYVFENVGFIGGGNNNAIYEYNAYATIAAGSGNTIGVSGGSTNGESCTIAGGSNNAIGQAASWGVIGGGGDNQIGAGLQYVVIAGGAYNTAVNTSYSFIGGGSHNTVEADYATVGGGGANIAGGTGSFAVGYLNTAAASYSTVVGGYDNTAEGVLSAVLGGVSNVADGNSAVVGGGANNTAYADFSFAAGYEAYADQTGCFVWADNSNNNPQKCLVDYNTSGPQSEANSFVVRATGGVQFVTQTNSAGVETAGISVGPGGNSWYFVSDRNKKHGFEAVDTRDALRRVVAMPITTWSYNSEEGARHIGPMAQDFHEAFPLSDDDTHVNSIDEDGAAFAAIQGLYAEIRLRDETISALTTRAASLEKANAEANQRVTSLEKRLEAIEAQLGVGK